MLLRGSLEQRRNYEEPFCVQRLPADRLACPTVPVRCVALIAFFAMKVGMHPRTLGTLILLGGFVRSLPIALSIPPQSGEREAEALGRIDCCEGLAKFVKRHFCISLDERPGWRNLILWSKQSRKRSTLCVTRDSA